VLEQLAANVGHDAVAEVDVVVSAPVDHDRVEEGGEGGELGVAPEARAPDREREPGRGRPDDGVDDRPDDPGYANDSANPSTPKPIVNTAYLR
jgi:hypothetical protein